MKRKLTRFARLARELLGSRNRPRPTATNARPQADPDPTSCPASAAAPSVRQPVEPWSLNALVGFDDGWEGSVGLGDGDVSSATWILAGRSTQGEVAIPMALAEGVASVTLPNSALAWFGTELLDVFVDLARPDGARSRHRIGVSGADRLQLLVTSSTPSARWYATVKHNLSVEASAQGAPSERPWPVLVGLTVQDSTTELSVTGDSSGAVAPTLLLVGRKSRVEVRTAVVSRPGGWTADVRGDQLAAFDRRESVDLWSEAAAPDGVRTRSPLRSDGIEVASTPGAPRRWQATEADQVGLRPPTAVELIAESGVFDNAFYRAQVPDLPPGLDPIEHYVQRGVGAGLNPSADFDTSYYRSMNPAVRRNPLAHYCDTGWRELRNPSPGFNTWWYWFTHLDPADLGTNPLAHYRAVGKQQGLSTLPDQRPSRRLGEGHRIDGEHGQHRQVRRVCLFAAYDPDGVVDDYVLDYVGELARHADVYYWADSLMPDSELAKLADITVGAWARPHGEYDFGSYARLAERIGWAALESYDELLLVNDSSYLLRPLDQVFARMDGRSCDWWGLQATKGTYFTRDVTANQFADPIPIEQVRTSLIDAFERDYTYDFHLGSYFLVFRQPVIADPAFRRYLSSVTTHEKKRDIIKRYEVGLTHWLIQHGHAFDTFVPNLYPFHPIFTDWYFRLLDDGFPLLKRYFLAENHYRVPQLVDWPARVQQKVPGVDVSPFQKNLARVTDPAKLYASLHVEPDAR